MPDASPSPDAPAADPNATPTPEAAPAAPPVNGGETPDTNGGAKAQTTIYRIHVGSFSTRDAAKALAAELTGRGYSSVIMGGKGDGGATNFYLQVGAYRDKKTADGIVKELKANGYDATLNK